MITYAGARALTHGYACVFFINTSGTHECINTYKHTHTYAYTSMCMHTHRHTHTHTHARTHTNTHTHTHIHTHTYLSAPLKTDAVKSPGSRGYLRLLITYRGSS